MESSQELVENLNGYYVSLVDEKCSTQIKIIEGITNCFGKLGNICIVNPPTNQDMLREALCNSEEKLIFNVIEILSLNPQNDALFEWAFLLINKSFLHLPQYYPKLNDKILDPLQTIDLPNQVQNTLLKLLLSAVEEVSIFDPVNTQLSSFLVENLISCLNFERQRTSNKELYEVIMSTISILSWCASQEDREDLKENLIKKGLVHVSLKLLERYPAKSTPLKEMKFNGGDESNPEVGMKSHLMKIIANLSHNNTECQDLIREEGGIPIILNHFVIDDNNPWLREWTILAVRNITENNEENQKFIASLELRDIPESAQEEWRSMGYDTKVEDGKLKVTKIPKK